MAMLRAMGEQPLGPILLTDEYLAIQEINQTQGLIPIYEKTVLFRHSCVFTTE
jgi:hypothetical protein